MGIFFRSEGVAPSLNQALITALNENPPATNDAAQARATLLAATVQPPSRTVNPWSVGLALLFLVALFVGCLYTASDDKLADLYKAMVHGFQVMLGLVPGALLGEGSAR
jgi:hypothetical protein